MIPFPSPGGPLAAVPPDPPLQGTMVAGPLLPLGGRQTRGFDAPNEILREIPCNPHNQQVAPARACLTPGPTAAVPTWSRTWACPLLSHLDDPAQARYSGPDYNLESPDFQR